MENGSRPKFLLQSVLVILFRTYVNCSITGFGNSPEIRCNSKNHINFSGPLYIIIRKMHIKLIYTVVIAQGPDQTKEIIQKAF